MTFEIPENKKLVYEMSIPVRWGDMDAMGHLNNGTYFRYLETARIDWNKTVHEIHNLIRGLSLFPGAFTSLQGKTLKIYRAEKEPVKPGTSPGNFETDGKSFLKFAAPDGYIRVKELQLEGKKKLAVEDFLRGYRFE